jgi:hypothetical protein
MGGAGSVLGVSAPEVGRTAVGLLAAPLARSGTQADKIQIRTNTTQINSLFKIDYSTRIINWLP